MLEAFANTGTSIKILRNKNNSVSIIPCKPTGLLIYIPATSPDSCAIVEHMYTLYRQQMTTHQQRLNHGSAPFPSPPCSALPLTFSKFVAFSDNCQPRVDNESAVSVIPEQPLNRADTQQQLNGSWAGNRRGNSEPQSASATHATTNGTAFPDPSTTSPCQPLSPRSPIQPSQPPQLVQPAQPIGTGSATRDKRRSMLCTCPNCVNSVNGVRNQDQTSRKERHICHYPRCGKAFATPSTLLTHLRRHRSEKLYICNWPSCGKRFTTSHDLKRHRLIHTGEKDYVCKECSKRFMRSDHLSSHAKTHDPLKLQRNNSSLRI